MVERVAGMVAKPTGLSHHQFVAAHRKCVLTLVCTRTTRNSRSLVCSIAVRNPSGKRRDRCMDQRTEEHPLHALLPPIDSLLPALRWCRTTAVVRAITTFISACLTQQERGRHAARRTTGVYLVETSRTPNKTMVAHCSVFHFFSGLWIHHRVVPVPQRAAGTSSTLRWFHVAAVHSSAGGVVLSVENHTAN